MRVNQPGNDGAAVEPNQEGARTDQRFEIAEAAVGENSSPAGGNRVAFGMTVDSPLVEENISFAALRGHLVSTPASGRSGPDSVGRGQWFRFFDFHLTLAAFQRAGPGLVAEDFGPAFLTLVAFSQC